MQKHKSHTSKLTLSAVTAFLLTAAGACGPDAIDNSYSRNNSTIQINASAQEIILNENDPDAVALTIDWSEAYQYGNDFITTYQFQIDAEGSRASSIKEYEDDGIYRRSYTNAQLQEMMVNHFGCLTSARTPLTFTITASFQGPRVVLPDISSTSVIVKTYGEKQFAADRLFMGGSAVEEENVELFPTSETSNIYTWTGSLKAGKLNFPVIFGDENNAIGPVEPDMPISDSEMDAAISDIAKANYWLIPESTTYRVTVDITNRTVKIVDAGNIIELDKLFMTGSAVGNKETEIAPALEAEGLFAWKGELNAGSIYFPMDYHGEKSIALVPMDQESHDIKDGTTQTFGQAIIEANLDNRYWDIPEAGTYRIVVNTTDHTVAFYSAATDMKNTEVSYNNTVDGINPYTQEVTELWMWGGFNDSAHDAGLKAGFQEKYKLIQSLADPNVFVYYGGNLPRGNSTDDWSKATATGALNFLVSSIENNVYAYGSTIDAKRNDHRGYLSVNLGETLKLVPGQSDNRYAYFCVPENCNYVVVDIKNLTVYFGHK